MSVWKFTLAGSSAVSSRQSITSGEVTFQGEPQSAVGFFGESLGISSAENKRNADAKLKDRVAIIKRTAQQIAMAAGKQLPMQFFMMWMAGNTVGIWTMMIISGAMWGPMNNLLFNIHKAFLPLGPVEPASLLYPYKLMYVGVNLASMCLGLWKFNKMGLLPVTAADWQHLLPVEHAAELAGGGALM